MARGSTQAQTGATQANNLSGTYGGNAGALYSTLAPQLETEAASPSGYAPTDLAAMNTAAQQSAGGSQSAAVGSGGLLAARTRNAGAPAAAVDSAARSASQGLSKAATGIQTKNADLKQKQQQAGLSGLENMYGQNEQGSIGALGETASNVNANNGAINSSYDWANSIFNPLVKAASAT